MTTQRQSVASNGQAIQAGNDVTIYNGISTDQLSAILIAVSNNINQCVQQAQEKFEERLTEFRDAIVEEFAKPENISNTSSFLDPDYQFSLHKASEIFGRDGGADLKSELVRLLAERSKLPSRSRPAFIINEAISISGSLTIDEYSTLVILFLIRYVRIGAGHRDELIDIIRMYLEIFENFRSDNSSIEYLSSMRCLSVNSISSLNLWQAIHNTYSFLFTDGFTVDDIVNIANRNGGIDKLTSNLFLLAPDSGSQAYFTFRDNTELAEFLKSNDYNEDDISKVTSLNESGLWGVDRVKEWVTERILIMHGLEHAWASTFLKNAELTALGKAIAHSALVSRTNFQGPLEIWVN